MTWDKFRELTRLYPATWWLREIVSIMLWMYIIVNSFLYDLDSAIVSKLHIPPAWQNPVYPPLIMLAVIITALLFLNRTRFWIYIGYVLVYPIVLLLFKIPRWFLRHWPLFVAFAPAMHSVSLAFRRNLIMISLLIMATITIQIASSKWLLWACVAYVVLFLLNHFYKKIAYAFLPYTVFNKAIDGVVDFGNFLSSSDTIAKMTPSDNPDEVSEEVRNKNNTNLLMSYVMLVILKVIARRLAQLSTSRRMDLYFVSSFLFTFSVTVLSFALVYQSIYKIDASHFVLTDSGSIWTFLGYSLSTIMTSDLATVSPNSDLSRLISFAEILGTLALLTLLAFLIMTSIRERYRDDLTSLVNRMEGASMQFSRVIESNFQLSIKLAEGLLVEINPSVMKWLSKYDPSISLPPPSPPNPADTDQASSEITPTSGTPPVGPSN